MKGAILPNSIWKKTQMGHLTSPASLLPLVGLINSGFTLLESTWKGRKQEFSLPIKFYWTLQVQFKYLLLGEGILKLSFSSEWTIPSFVFPEPLAGLEQDHRSLISWLSSYNCFPYHRVFFGDRHYPFYLSLLELLWFLWQTFTSVKLSWIPAICTVTSSVTLGRLLNILGPRLSALRAEAVKNTAHEHSSY